MLGAAKTSISTIITPASYEVFISPSPVVTISGNGASTSPKATANVTGGVGPFTYLWTIDSAGITINSDTEKSSSFSASGYNTDIEGVATITVTDTGNGNAETTDTVNIIFVFGIQP